MLGKSNKLRNMTTIFVLDFQERKANKPLLDNASSCILVIIKDQVAHAIYRNECEKSCALQFYQKF